MRPNIQNLLAEFSTRLRLQRYASSSIKTFTNALTKFLQAFQNKSLDQLSVQEIAYFLSTLQKNQQLSPAYQRQILASIAKFYQLFFNIRLDVFFIPEKKNKSTTKVFNRVRNQAFVFPLSKPKTVMCFTILIWLWPSCF